MARIALRISYDGRRFAGWQTQPRAAALQDLVESALGSVAAEPIRTICAGRTDAGVHALTQVVHFDTQACRPLSAWVRGANRWLPPDVAVESAIAVDESFHARYGAIRRRYHYLLWRGRHRDPLRAARAGWVHQALDVDAMRLAAEALIGRHDFSAFRSSQCQARSPVRDLQRLSIGEHGQLLVFEVIANAFLHHMVRNLLGALVWVGMGRREPAWIGEILRAGDRRLAAPTFDAAGLYLTGVDYGPGGFTEALASWPKVGERLGIGAVEEDSGLLGIIPG